MLASESGKFKIKTPEEAKNIKQNLEEKGKQRIYFKGQSIIDRESKMQMFGMPQPSLTYANMLQSGQRETYEDHPDDDDMDFSSFLDDVVPNTNESEDINESDTDNTNLYHRNNVSKFSNTFRRDVLPNPVRKQSDIEKKRYSMENEKSFARHVTLKIEEPTWTKNHMNGQLNPTENDTHVVQINLRPESPVDNNHDNFNSDHDDVSVNRMSPGNSPMNKHGDLIFVDDDEQSDDGIKRHVEEPMYAAVMKLNKKNEIRERSKTLPVSDSFSQYDIHTSDNGEKKNNISIQNVRINKGDKSKIYGSMDNLHNGFNGLSNGYKTQDDHDLYASVNGPMLIGHDGKLEHRKTHQIKIMKHPNSLGIANYLIF